VTNHKLLILGLLVIMGNASAQAVNNATMTSAYQQLYYDNPIGGMLTAYTAIWGSWFYLLLILGPYAMMYIYHGHKLTIANMWLLTTLAAYEYLVADMAQDFVFYACVVAMVTSILMKVLNPYTEK
jgi:uncharacterized membrane protein YhaH (DUF805 family)